MKRRFAGWSGARGAVGSALLLVTIAVLSACGGRNGQGSPPSFDAARSYTVPYGESAVVAISDLDGDGRPDLVAANYLNLLADEEDNSVSVLLNRGDGSFRASRDYRSAYGAASVAIGDVNGDSRPDLAQMGTGTVSVFINKGNGSFHARREYRTGIGADAYPIAIGDLNGDGKLDLVTAKVAADRPGAVSVLLNWGDGNSQAKLAYRTIFGRDLHDLNGDGKPDLVFENCDDADSVSVLLNRGDGSFRARQDYPTPSAPCGLVIGDLNGDGKPDLAIANYDSDTVSVFLNRGDGSF